MRILKKVLIYSFSSIGLILLLLFILPFLFKGKIVRLTKDYLNKTIVNARVDVKDINLSIFSSFPDLRLSIEGLHIQNDSSFQNLELLSAGNIALDLDIMSVIKGEKYKVNLVSLDGINANVLVLADGRANYDIFKKDSSATLVEQENKQKSTDNSFSLQLKKLQVSQANLSYKDDKSNMQYAAEDLNFLLSGDLGAERSVLKLLLKIAKTNALIGSIKYANDTKVEFKAELDADLKNQKYILKENNLQLNAFILKLDGFVQLLKNAYDLNLNIVAPKVSLKDILSLIPSLYTKDYNNMIAQGKISFEAFTKGIYDSTRIPSFTLKLNIDDGSFKYPSLPKTVQDINAHLFVENTDGVLDHTKVMLNSLHVSFAENPIDMSMSLLNPISDPNIDLKLNGHLDLNKLKDFVPAETLKDLSGKMDADIQIQGKKSMIINKQYNKVKAQGNFVIKDLKYINKSLNSPAFVHEIALEFNQAKVSLKNLEAKLGSSDLRLQGVVANFLEYLFGKDQELSGNFQLYSNKLNLNELMPKTDTTKVAQTQVSEKLDSSSKTKPIAVPDKINMSLNTHIKNILFDKWHIQNFNGNVTINNQKASLQKILFSMLGANFTIDGSYNTKNIHQPKVNFSSHINNLNIQSALVAFPSLEKIVKIAKECHGIINCNVNFNTLLSDSMTPILPTLNANGEINTKTVHLDGEMTRGLLGLLENLNLPDPILKDIDLKFKIQNGALTINPFEMNLGPLSGVCSANYNLSGDMNMSYKAKVPTSMIQNLLQEQLLNISPVLDKAKEYGITLENVLPNKLGVNIIANGQVNNPKYSIKIDQNFSAELKRNLEQSINKKLNQMKDKLINEAKEKAEIEINKHKEKIKKQIDQEKDKLINEGKQKLKELFNF